MIPRRHSHAALAVFVLAFITITNRSVHAAGVVTQCNDDTDFSAKLAGGGTVTFDCGTATIVLSSTKTISGSVTIDGGGTITLSGDNARRLFVVNDRARLELNNITIEKGFSKSGHGGAIYNLDTVNISNSTFRNNATTSEWNGGAIYSSSHLAISFSTFTNNEAGSGGAIYTQSAINQTNVYDTMFDQNFATEELTTGFGGAVYVSDGANLTVNLSRFTNNEARTGGAIAVRSGSRLSIDGSTISDNTTARDGGGIDFDVSTAYITNVTMSRNYGQQGGAINIFAGEVTLDRVTLSRNTAIYGAGMNAYLGTHTFTNSTFSGNEAQSSAGAIYNLRCKMTLLNVTLAGNSAGSVGGIVNNAGGPTPDLRLKNVVIAKGASGTNCGFVYPATSLEFSLSDDATCGFGAGRDNASIMLGPLANNSGLTQTHLPNPGSPAIDGGTASGCPATDQRGLPRPFGATCDVGAVEVGPATPTPTHTRTGTATSTFTVTPTRTRTATPTTSATPTPTTTPTMTPTATASATESRTPTRSASATATHTGTATPSPSTTVTIAAPRCVGDCDNSRTVVINELVLMVNIALDRQPLSACPAADADASGTTTVQEILVGVNNAQRGCGIN